MAFTVKLITPERALPDLQADHVTLVAVDGQVGIRTGHAPLVALLKDEGYAVVRTSGTEQYRAFALRGGVAQVLDNVLKILTPSAVDAHALDQAAAEKKAAATKEEGDRRWLSHQLAVAKQFPPPVGRV
jgi:F-type H+-transporting ATPase subunit epsilon